MMCITKNLSFALCILYQIDLKNFFLVTYVSKSTKILYLIFIFSLIAKIGKINIQTLLELISWHFPTFLEWINLKRLKSLKWIHDTINMKLENSKLVECLSHWACSKLLFKLNCTALTVPIQITKNSIRGPKI